MTAKYVYLGPNKRNNDTDRHVVISEDVALWLMRMCVGEGGTNCSAEKAAAMMWGLVNRYLLHRGRYHWPTFKFLVRHFSQPINPRWMAGGDLARKYAGTKHASPAKLARRKRISSLKLSEIPSHIRSIVFMFQIGNVVPPAVFDEAEEGKNRISNWASLPSTPRKNPQGVDIDGDWFFEDKGLCKGRVIVQKD